VVLSLDSRRTLSEYHVVTLKATRLDEIGDWSELKLRILTKYAAAYTRILRSKRLHPIYIDGFAGAGEHISRGSQELVPGSPINALRIEPPFEKIHLVDLKPERIENLERLAAGDRRVKLYTGDANAILLNQVLPSIKYEAYERALCVLDPYGLNLDWKIMSLAGQSKTIEIFLNFPVMDMNRNVLWRSGDAPPGNIARMNSFWGDESWRDVAYSTEMNLFKEPEKQSNEAIASGFRERLKKVAGFQYVPEPSPMRNSNGAVVYYLFFAAQKPEGANIVTDILDRYRKQGRLRG
jgi:three-Cys-motif partner protein